MANYDEALWFSFKTVSATNIHWRYRRLICMILFVSTSYKGKAQSSVEYSVHANIIYHFTKYIDWPDNKKDGDFVIGVVGDTPLFDELKKVIGNKMAGNQKIIVKNISPSSTSFDCHILFLSEEESTSLKKINARIAESSILLVCEDEGAASRGACINFKIESQRLKLEINKTNIQQHRLNIAGELLRLGTVVK
jgi:hypothetical protein